MREIVVVLVLAFAAFFVGQWWADAETICDSKPKLIEVQGLVSGPNRCMVKTYNRMVEIGKEISVCDRLFKSLTKLNTINRVYTPKTFNEWLYANDLEGPLPTYKDYVIELRAWHRYECNANNTPKIKREPTVNRQ